MTPRASLVRGGIVALTLAGILGLSACGSSDTADTASDQSESPAASTSEAEPTTSSTAAETPAGATSAAYTDFIAEYPDCASVGAVLGSAVEGLTAQVSASSVSETSVQCAWSSSDGSAVAFTAQPGTGTVTDGSDLAAAGATVEPVADAGVEAAGGKAFTATVSPATVTLIALPDIVIGLTYASAGGDAPDSAASLASLKPLLGIS